MEGDFKIEWIPYSWVLKCSSYAYNLPSGSSGGIYIERPLGACCAYGWVR